jgi:succinate-semialdehyde dehydrogenase/glutarate-semialdehyde dehydrogenase
MPILEQAGVPKGVISVLPSRQSGKLVDALLHDPRVRVVSFTGSTEVGRQLLRAAADNVINSAMELGGNAPFVVFEDADLDKAVEGAVIAKMRNMGEACTAANRFYVHDAVYDAFAQKLAARLGAMRIGNGLEEGVEVGSLVDEETRGKVMELVEDALGRGARVLTGGKPIDGPGFFYPPTVLADVPPDARCVREEIFGPVAPLVRFSDEAEAVAACNGTEYGLVAYVFTRDLKRGLAFSERLDFGMVGLNRGLVSDPAAPFGGMKQSGIGREGGHHGIMEYLETQYISTDW